MRAIVLGIRLLVASPAVADCRGDIIELLNADMGSYRATAIVGESPYWRSITLEVVQPDRIHFKGALLPEVIVVGSNGWTMQDEQWIPLPHRSADEFRRSLGPIGRVTAEAVIDPLCLGERRVDGVAVVAYSATIVMHGVEMPTTIHADPATGAISSMEGTIETGGVSSDYIMLFDYDPTLTIVAPINERAGRRVIATASIP